MILNIFFRFNIVEMNLDKHMRFFSILDKVYGSSVLLSLAHKLCCKKVSGELGGQSAPAAIICILFQNVKH